MANIGLQSLMTETATKESSLIKESAGLINKWEPTHLLEGLESDYEKRNMALMLDNQAKRLVYESSRLGTSANSEEWNGIALPLVRRVFGNTVAKEFVSVQPMNMPSGLVFFLDFKYGTAQPGFENGSGKDSQDDSVWGVTREEGEATGGLYGDGRHGYTINDVSSSALSVGTAINATTFVSGALSAATQYNHDTEWSQSVAALGNTFGALTDSIFTITVSTGSMASPDLTGVSAFKIAGTGISAYYPQFTTLNSTKTQITFLVSGSAAALSTDAVLTYHKQPSSDNRGDFEFSKTQESPLDIPELNMEFRSEEIVAKTRKLKTSWTPEFQQDVNAYHSIDAEAELTTVMGDYISREVDLELLEMLRGASVNNAAWSAKLGKFYNGNSFENFSSVQGETAAYTRTQWFQELMITINGISNQIYQKTQLGSANWLVTSPKIATIFQSMPGFNSDATKDLTKTFSAGTKKVGNFRGEFDVYVIPYYQNNEILMGYKGNSFLHTGAVYAPYIPLISTPIIWDPNNYVPSKALMTRYAKHVYRPEFYGKVKVDGLETVYGL